MTVNFALYQPLARWHWTGYVASVEVDPDEDETDVIQDYIDYCSDNNLGTLIVPPGTYTGNWTIKSDVIIQGSGVNSTIFQAATDDAVFKTSTSADTEHIGFRDCRIVGVTSNTAQDGIRLGATATTVNDVVIENVQIWSCGRYGLWAFGDNLTTSFVQRLNMRSVTARACEHNGIRLEGAILETTGMNVSAVNCGNNAGDNPGMYIGEETTNNTLPRRVTFIGGVVHRSTSLGLGNAPVGVHINQAAEVGFIGYDFESADPMMKVDGSNTRNVLVQNCHFSTDKNITAPIVINDCDTMTIEQAKFSCTGTVTNLIRGTTTMARTRNLRIVNFDPSGSSPTKAVNIVENQNVASNAIKLLRETMSIGNGGGGAATVNTIQDSSGGTTEHFYHGQHVVLMPEDPATDPITIAHNADNIMVAGGADFAMNEVGDWFEAYYDGDQSKWVGVGHSIT